MRQDTVKALSDSALFRDLSADEIELALARSRYRITKYHKGTIYALRGSSCQSCDIILSGTLTVRMTSATGRLMDIIRLAKGNMITPCHIFADNHRLPVEIEADTDVSIMSMTATTLDSLIVSSNIIRRNFIRIISDAGILLASRLRFASMLTIREKICHTIREEVKRQKSLVVHIAASRQELANTFGVQKFSVIRALASLERSGAIKVDGRTITVTDICQLAD